MRQVDCIPYNRFVGIPEKSPKQRLIVALRRCANFIEDGTMNPSEVVSVISEFVAGCQEV